MDLVQKLLQIDKNNARKKRREKFRSGNMQLLVGDPEIEIQEIDPERLTELQTLPLDENGKYNYQQSYTANLMTTVEGVVNPDLKNKELQAHFGVGTANDLAKLLFKAEVSNIADAITTLSSPDVIEDEEVKN